MRFALLLSLAFRFARADSPEDRFLKELTHAKTARELRDHRAEFERARIARLACAMETREGRAPLACYEVAGENRVKLDRLCARACARLNIEEEPETLSPSVSPACREKILEARKIRRYRADDAWSDF